MSNSPKGSLKDKMSAQEFRDYLDKTEKAKGSLYKAIPTQTADGQNFKSILESTFYNRMWVLQKAGEVVKIEREVEYELTVNGHFITRYMMDFRITYADGRIDYVDCKSAPTVTPLYKLKRALMFAIHGIQLREVYE